jgi:hypothetical protein
MHQQFLAKAALLVALASSALACSHAQAVCEKICECEHCNDQEEIVTCDQYETSQDVADAYSCGDKFDAYLTCIEDKGTCDETLADYSTRGGGSCSGTQPLGMSCMTANDCNGGGGGDVVCNGGMCMLTVCAGSGQPCQNNGDCNGQDLCDSEQNDYFTCVDNASGHGGVAGGF